MNEQARVLIGNQAEAAHTLDRHISVTAGPGAGKTLVLVERYLHILRSNPIGVDQIVAITFTNRAANEMRERLRHKLDHLLRASSGSERARWMRHKRTLDGAIITTIHGFCARLLREFPLEAGIDPQFALLDQHQSAMLEESVAEQAITESITAGDEAISRLALGFGRTSLVAAVLGIYRSIRNQGLTLDRVEVLTAGSHASIEQYTATLNELSLKMSQFIAARGLTTAADEKRLKAAERWPHLVELLRAEPGSISLPEYCQAIEDFRETRLTRSNRTQVFVDSLDPLIWQDKLGGAVPRLFFDIHAANYAQAVTAVVKRLEERLSEEKRRLSALDFDDLQLLAMRVLTAYPAVRGRVRNRYHYFLIDEFQDTNGLQRHLIESIAFGTEGRRANLFIVGDRKQSVYGFRGADVDVFREMTARIAGEGGSSIPLNLNFRSQQPLVHFFNHLFSRVFDHGEVDPTELGELGYVEHEPGIAQREDQDTPPLIELMIDVRPESNEGSARELDARQLAHRILSLVGSDGKTRFRDVALLFRAMTEASTYESQFRREGIPFITVQGKGFYAREEITDLIQLLRFLDNKTDELALAAVLRSPLCGLSDGTLLALRRGPVIGETPELLRRNRTRPLLEAVRYHEQNQFIEPNQRAALDHTRALLKEMVERSRRSGLAALLRFAVERSEYRQVIAANYDGAQRLANIEKLFNLAERFEGSGAHLTRDFVKFVHDFEEAGGRESEGQMDESANAVRLMTVHQSKGLEFPVAILPELQRRPEFLREWYVLDRHLGLTVAIPDGRGGRVKGQAFERFGKRAKLRERFESMRLLYVAATRARDRLILSGVTKELAKLSSDDTWLGWIWKSLDPGDDARSRTLEISESLRVQLTVNLTDQEPEPALDPAPRAIEALDISGTFDERFPLLVPPVPERGMAIHRFSVTQLLNYRRCPRQYYFDRVLHAPSGEEIAVWNDVEAPEPPANLTATLRGAVIHRFCETHSEGVDADACLSASFDHVVRLRDAELGDRLAEIDRSKGLQELRPLAEHYLRSPVRERIELARAVASELAVSPDRSAYDELAGVLSERRFRLRRPLGLLVGTIDKLLVLPSIDGEGLSIEIIDFKTDRFRVQRAISLVAGPKTPNRRKRDDSDQLAFGFLEDTFGTDLLVHAEVAAAASDYQLQMQAYVLAVRELMPAAREVKVTLHFLDPELEVSLPEELVEGEVCARAIDDAIAALVSPAEPSKFPVRPADHCRSCRFLSLCPAGLRHIVEL